MKEHLNFPKALQHQQLNRLRRYSTLSPTHMLFCFSTPMSTATSMPEPTGTVTSIPQLHSGRTYVEHCWARRKLGTHSNTLYIEGYNEAVKGYVDQLSDIKFSEKDRVRFSGATLSISIRIYNRDFSREQEQVWLATFCRRPGNSRCNP